MPPRERELHLQTFDLLELQGEFLTDRPLMERKDRLALLLEDAPARLRYVDHVRGNGPAVFAQADAMDLEGIVSKRADSGYQVGQRSSDWLKTKCWRVLRFPVARYMMNGGRLVSLLLAAEGPGGLAYAGRVEFGLWGFPGLLDVLSGVTVDPSPLGREIRGAQWIREGIEAEVRALPWANGRKVRRTVLRRVLPRSMAA